MNAYRILIHDARLAQVVVLKAEMARDERACEFARERLAGTAHYASVEVWRGEKRLCAYARAPAEPPRAAA